MNKRLELNLVIRGHAGFFESFPVSTGLEDALGSKIEKDRYEEYIQILNLSHESSNKNKMVRSMLGIHLF